MNTANKKQILALSGSLKRSSYNHKLLLNAVDLIPSELADVSTIHLADFPLPLFNEEIEHGDIPNLPELRTYFSHADALIIASPEYNGSLTPALKNVIDWLSRTAKDKSYKPKFNQQVAALMAASPGGLGGIRGLRHLSEILNNIGTLVLPTTVAVPSAMNAFDDEGKLTHNSTLNRLTQQSDRLLNQLGVK